jgi:hypothetical protein
MINLLFFFVVVGVLVSAFKGGGGGSGKAQRVGTFDLNKPFIYCGERFPMDNTDVRQRLDAELLRTIYFHSQTILALERAHAVFPVIEPILKAEGVPDDLKYLAVAESNLTNAISPSGAKGIWQFMKSAAAEHHLEVSEEVDERYHLEKATVAACRYLRGQRNKLGSWILAAAAYNGGPERISQEVARQGAKSFFDLNLAADETMRYPFRIMAIKEVMQHPELYDYEIDPSHLYAPLSGYRVERVVGGIPNLATFASERGISYRTLKVYNPWLMGSKLTNIPGKVYEVRIPR